MLHGILTSLQHLDAGVVQLLRSLTAMASPPSQLAGSTDLMRLEGSRGRGAHLLLGIATGLLLLIFLPNLCLLCIELLQLLDIELL